MDEKATSLVSRHNIKFCQLMTEAVEAFDDHQRRANLPVHQVVIGYQTALQTVAFSAKFYPAADKDLTSVCKRLYEYCAVLVLDHRWLRLPSATQVKAAQEFYSIHCQLTDWAEDSFMVMAILAQNPWGGGVLSAVMNGTGIVGKQEVNKYLTTEGQFVLEHRLRILIQDGFLNQALNLSKACVGHPKLGQEPIFLETLVLLCYKLGLYEGIEAEVTQHPSVAHLIRVARSLASYSPLLASVVSQLGLVRVWARPSEAHWVQELSGLWVETSWSLYDPDACRFGVALDRISRHTVDPLYLFYLADAVYKKVDERVCSKLMTLCLRALSVPSVGVTQDVFQAASIDNGNVAVCHLLSQVLKWDVRLQRLCLLAAFFIAPSVDNYFLLKNVYSRSVSSASHPSLSSYHQCHLSRCLRHFIPEDIPLSGDWANISKTLMKYLHRSKVVNTTWKLPNGKLQVLRVHIKSWCPDNESSNLPSMKDFKASCSRALESCKRGTSLVSVKQEVQRLPDSEKLAASPKQSKADLPTKDISVESTGNSSESDVPLARLLSRPESKPVCPEGKTHDNTEDFFTDSTGAIINDDILKGAQVLFECFHNSKSSKEMRLSNSESRGHTACLSQSGRRRKEPPGHLVDESLRLISCPAKGQQPLTESDLLLTSAAENNEAESAQCIRKRIGEDSRQNPKPFFLEINKNKVEKRGLVTTVEPVTIPSDSDTESDLETHMEGTDMIQEGQTESLDENTLSANESEALILDRVMGKNCVLDDEKHYPTWSNSITHDSIDNPTNHQSTLATQKGLEKADIQMKQATNVEMRSDCKKCSESESHKDLDPNLHMFSNLLTDELGTHKNGHEVCRASNKNTLIVVKSPKVYNCMPEESNCADGKQGMTIEYIKRNSDCTLMETEGSAKQDGAEFGGKDSEMLTSAKVTKALECDLLCGSPLRPTNETDGEQIKASGSPMQDAGKHFSSENTAEAVMINLKCYPPHRLNNERESDIVTIESNISEAEDDVLSLSTDSEEDTSHNTEEAVEYESKCSSPQKHTNEGDTYVKCLDIEVSSNQNTEEYVIRESEIKSFEKVTDMVEKDPICCYPHDLTNDRNGNIKKIETKEPLKSDLEVLTTEDMMEISESEPMYFSPHRASNGRDCDIKEEETEMSSSQNYEELVSTDAEGFISKNKAESANDEPTNCFTAKPTEEKVSDINRSDVYSDQDAEEPMDTDSEVLPSHYSHYEPETVQSKHECHSPDRTTNEENGDIKAVEAGDSLMQNGQEPVSTYAEGFVSKNKAESVNDEPVVHAAKSTNEKVSDINRSDIYSDQDTEEPMDTDSEVLPCHYEPETVQSKHECHSPDRSTNEEDGGIKAVEAGDSLMQNGHELVSTKDSKVMTSVDVTDSVKREPNSSWQSPTESNAEVRQLKREVSSNQSPEERVSKDLNIFTSCDMSETEKNFSPQEQLVERDVDVKQLQTVVSSSQNAEEYVSKELEVTPTKEIVTVNSEPMCYSPHRPRNKSDCEVKQIEMEGFAKQNVDGLLDTDSSDMLTLEILNETVKKEQQCRSLHTPANDSDDDIVEVETDVYLCQNAEKPLGIALEISRSEHLKEIVKCEETSTKLAQKQETHQCCDALEVDPCETTQIAEENRDSVNPIELDIDYDLECSVATALYEKLPSAEIEVLMSNNNCPSSKENDSIMSISESIEEDSKKQNNQSEDNEPKSGIDEENITIGCTSKFDTDLECSVAKALHEMSSPAGENLHGSLSARRDDCPGRMENEPSVSTSESVNDTSNKQEKSPFENSPKSSEKEQENLASENASTIKYDLECNVARALDDKSHSVVEEKSPVENSLKSSGKEQESLASESTSTIDYDLECDVARALYDKSHCAVEEKSPVEKSLKSSGKEQENLASENTSTIDYDLECDVARALYDKSHSAEEDVDERTSIINDKCSGNQENDLGTSAGESSIEGTMVVDQGSVDSDLISQTQRDSQVSQDERTSISNGKCSGNQTNDIGKCASKSSNEGTMVVDQAGLDSDPSSQTRRDSQVSQENKFTFLALHPQGPDARDGTSTMLAIDDEHIGSQEKQSIMGLDMDSTNKDAVNVEQDDFPSRRKEGSLGKGLMNVDRVNGHKDQSKDCKVSTTSNSQFSPKESQVPQKRKSLFPVTYSAKRTLRNGHSSPTSPTGQRSPLVRTSVRQKLQSLHSGSGKVMTRQQAKNKKVTPACRCNACI